MTDLTREELMAWPMELRVAIDAMGAVPREVTRGEAEWVIGDAAAWCWSGEERLRRVGAQYAARRHGRSMYELWRGNDAPVDPRPFDHSEFHEVQFDGRVWGDAGSAEPLPITYGLMPWEWDSDRIFREIDEPYDRSR